jgi:hypothetical protein
MSGFEPTVPVFERAKRVHALDRAATVIGPMCLYRNIKGKLSVTWSSFRDETSRGKDSPYEHRTNRCGIKFGVPHVHWQWNSRFRIFLRKNEILFAVSRNRKDIFQPTFNVCVGTSFTLVSCLVYSSILKMVATCSSDTSVDIQRTKRWYIPEGKLFLFIVLPVVSYGSVIHV